MDDKDLTEPIQWAEATFANAEDLFIEAVMLRKAGHLSRALFLHQISMEECGKVEVLGAWVTGVFAGLKRDATKLQRALTRHETKNSANAYQLELSDQERHARRRKD